MMITGMEILDIFVEFHDVVYYLWCIELPSFIDLSIDHQYQGTHFCAHTGISIRPSVIEIAS